MRVHRPRPGEAADRLSVLCLKIYHAKQAGKGISHFDAERIELSEYMQERYLGHASYDFFVASIDSLLRINTEIWGLIDKQHDFKAKDKDYAAWSRETVKLNDLRAGLIKEINSKFGVEEGEEKI